MGGGILWEASTVPGSTKLIGGNSQAGFYGEVPSDKFITGDELASRVGLTAGAIQFSNEPWLKFSYNGKIEFVAKKPFRCFISKENLFEENLVYGDKLVEINGNKYKVRLFKGKMENDGRDDWYRFKYNIDGEINYKSEWNSLMLPIHQNAPNNWKNYYNVKLPTENWNIGYTDRDLITHSDYGNGSFSLCQENGEDSSHSLIRGGYGVSYSSSVIVESGYSDYGWRPVLELII